MSNPIRAVLFDLDGTLADSLSDIGGAVNEVLAARGLPIHPIPAYLQFIGEGAEELIARALPPDRPDLVQPALADYRKAYPARLTRETRLYPGVPEMLDGVVERGLAMAVLSNKPDASTRALSEALLSRWPFRIVFGERAGIPRKPDPSAALEIARQLGVPPGQCAFVGDTAIDMQTAVAAGMHGVGVLWGFRSRQELEASGARVVLADPRHLSQAIARIDAGR